MEGTLSYIDANSKVVSVKVSDLSFEESGIVTGYIKDSDNIIILSKMTQWTFRGKE